MSRIYDALKKAETDSRAPEHRQGFAESLFEATQMHTRPDVQDEAGLLQQGLEEVVEPVAEEECFATSDCSTTPAVPEHPFGSWKLSPNCDLFGDGANANSVAAEQFRRLRSRLYQIRKKQPLNRILVSSAIANEGKTFLCANLAQALVRHGSSPRVLLIDSDLRKPSLHMELGAAAAPGLSDYLRGSADHLATIQHGPIKNLSFISGGTTVSNPAELIASGRFQQLLDSASKMFDWVILDSSPVVPISDATVLAPHCDGVLLVVRAGSTPFDLAQKAKEEFRNSVLLGVVLNQVNEMLSYKPYYYAYKGSASSEPAQSAV